MVHQDGEHGPEEEADERDGHGVLDERRDDPDGDFEAGEQVSRMLAKKQDPRHSSDIPDDESGVEEERPALSDLCAFRSLASLREHCTRTFVLNHSKSTLPSMIPAVPSACCTPSCGSRDVLPPKNPEDMYPALELPWRCSRI